MMMKIVEVNGETKLLNIRHDATVYIDLQTNCKGHCSDCTVVQDCRKIDELVYGPKDETKCDGYCIVCPAVRDCMKIKRSISTGYQWKE